MAPLKRDIALLGFPAVGKSSIVCQFAERKFDANYVTTIANEKECTFNVCGKEFLIHVFDTMGVTELQTMEDRYYGMHGWILVYSVVERRSFEVLAEIYDKLKLSTSQEKLPIVVVGNKTDLVDSNKREVAKSEGQQFATNVNAVFIESSAKSSENVNKVFELAIKEIEKSNGQPLKEPSGCAIS